MSTAVKRRRGTTAQHAAFTGQLGELTVDTDKDTVVVHDGVTAGGHPLARAQDIPLPGKLFGIVADGATNDLVAFQAALDALPTGTSRTLQLPPGTICIEGTLNWPVTLAAMRLQGSPYGTTIKYTKGSSYGPMLKCNIDAAYGSEFRDLIFDTNQKATHGFKFAEDAGSADPIVCKNVRWVNCYVLNLTNGSIGWMIGDRTNALCSMDAWNFSWHNSHARGGSGSIGWQIDTHQAFNNSWFNCSHGQRTTGDYMTTGIKTLSGSGFRVYNYFGDRLQAAGWVIDHTGGSFSVFGMDTEFSRVLKARQGPTDENDDDLIRPGEWANWYEDDNQRVILQDVQVNYSLDQGGTSVDSQLNTTLISCSFATRFDGNVYYRTITTTKNLFAVNCFIGTTAGNAGTWSRSATAINVIIDETAKILYQENLQLKHFGAGPHDIQSATNTDGAELLEVYPTLGAAGAEYTNLGAFAWFLCGADAARVGMKFLNQGIYNSRLWVDDTGDLRTSNANPSADDSGTVVGTQTFSGTHIYKLGDLDLQIGEAVKLVNRKLYRTTSEKDPLCCGVFAGKSTLTVTSFDEVVPHTMNAQGEIVIAESDKAGAVIALGDTRFKQSGQEIDGVLVDGPVTKGSYGHASNTPGRFTQQADDVMHSYTVVKFMEDGDGSGPVYAYILS